jgi:MFS family permease
MILARSKPALVLPTLMVIWVGLSQHSMTRLTLGQGGMSIGAKGISSFAGMVVFRIALGLVEAGFFPGVMLLMSCWYKVRTAQLGWQLTVSPPSCPSASPRSTRRPLYPARLVGCLLEESSRGWRGSVVPEVGNGKSPALAEADVRLFIIEGLATVVIAVGAYFVLPSE